MIATWEACREQFESDGSLRDVYVRQACSEVWGSAFAFLSRGGDTRFMIDGVDAPLPRSHEEAFRLRPGSHPLLVVRREGIEYCCHFFSTEEVELDFLPQDVSGEKRFVALTAFIRGLGLGSRRDVFVTPENQPHLWFLRYEVARDEVLGREGAG
jgi:hypothetical protein